MKDRIEQLKEFEEIQKSLYATDEDDNEEIGNHSTIMNRSTRRKHQKGISKLVKSLKKKQNGSTVG